MASDDEKAKKSGGVRAFFRNLVGGSSAKSGLNTHQELKDGVNAKVLQQAGDAAFIFQSNDELRKSTTLSSEYGDLGSVALNQKKNEKAISVANILLGGGAVAFKSDYEKALVIELLNQNRLLFNETNGAIKLKQDQILPTQFELSTRLKDIFVNPGNAADNRPVVEAVAAPVKGSIPTLSPNASDAEKLAYVENVVSKILQKTQNVRVEFQDQASRDAVAKACSDSGINVTGINKKNFGFLRVGVTKKGEEIEYMTEQQIAQLKGALSEKIKQELNITVAPILTANVALNQTSSKSTAQRSRTPDELRAHWDQQKSSAATTQSVPKQKATETGWQKTSPSKNTPVKAGFSGSVKRFNDKLKAEQTVLEKRLETPEVIPTAVNPVAGKAQTTPNQNKSITDEINDGLTKLRDSGTTPEEKAAAQAKATSTKGLVQVLLETGIPLDAKAANYQAESKQAMVLCQLLLSDRKTTVLDILQEIKSQVEKNQGNPQEQQAVISRAMIMLKTVVELPLTTRFQDEMGITALNAATSTLTRGNGHIQNLNGDDVAKKISEINQLLPDGLKGRLEHHIKGAIIPDVTQSAAQTSVTQMESKQLTSLETLMSNVGQGKQKNQEQSVVNMAEDLSSYATQLYSQVKLDEYYELAWSKDKTKDVQAPNLSKVMDYYNVVAQNLVVVSIIKGSLNDEKAMIRKAIFWAEVMNQSLKKGDYATAYSILVAFNNGALPQSSFDNNAKLQALMQEPKRIFNVEGSFFELRNEYKKKAQANEKITPYIGIYCTDLTMVMEGNPREVEGRFNIVRSGFVGDALTKVRQGEQYSASALSQNEKRTFDVEAILTQKPLTEIELAAYKEHTLRIEKNTSIKDIHQQLLQVESKKLMVDIISIMGDGSEFKDKSSRADSYTAILGEMKKRLGATPSEEDKRIAGEIVALAQRHSKIVNLPLKDEAKKLIDELKEEHNLKIPKKPDLSRVGQPSSAAQASVSPKKLAESQVVVSPVLPTIVTPTAPQVEPVVSVATNPVRPNTPPPNIDFKNATPKKDKGAGQEQPADLNIGFAKTYDQVKLAVAKAADNYNKQVDYLEHLREKPDDEKQPNHSQEVEKTEKAVKETESKYLEVRAVLKEMERNATAEKIPEVSATIIPVGSTTPLPTATVTPVTPSIIEIKVANFTPNKGKDIKAFFDEVLKEIETRPQGKEVTVVFENKGNFELFQSRLEKVKISPDANEKEKSLEFTWNPEKRDELLGHIESKSKELGVHEEKVWGEIRDTQQDFSKTLSLYNDVLGRFDFNQNELPSTLSDDAKKILIENLIKSDKIKLNQADKITVNEIYELSGFKTLETYLRAEPEAAQKLKEITQLMKELQVSVDKIRGMYQGCSTNAEYRALWQSSQYKEVFDKYIKTTEKITYLKFDLDASKFNQVSGRINKPEPYDLESMLMQPFQRLLKMPLLYRELKQDSLADAENYAFMDGNFKKMDEKIILVNAERKNVEAKYITKIDDVLNDLKNVDKHDVDSAYKMINKILKNEKIITEVSTKSKEDKKFEKEFSEELNSVSKILFKHLKENLQDRDKYSMPSTNVVLSNVLHYEMNVYMHNHAAANPVDAIQGVKFKKLSKDEKEGLNLIGDVNSPFVNPKEYIAFAESNLEIKQLRDDNVSSLIKKIDKIQDPNDAHSTLMTILTTLEKSTVEEILGDEKKNEKLTKLKGIASGVTVTDAMIPNASKRLLDNLQLLGLSAVKVKVPMQDAINKDLEVLSVGEYFKKTMEQQKQVEGKLGPLVDLQLKIDLINKISISESAESNFSKQVIKTLLLELIQTDLRKQLDSGKNVDIISVAAELSGRFDKDVLKQEINKLKEDIGSGAKHKNHLVQQAKNAPGEENKDEKASRRRRFGQTLDAINPLKSRRRESIETETLAANTTAVNISEPTNVPVDKIVPIATFPIKPVDTNDEEKMTEWAEKVVHHYFKTGTPAPSTIEIKGKADTETDQLKLLVDAMVTLKKNGTVFNIPNNGEFIKQLYDLAKDYKVEEKVQILLMPVSPNATAIDSKSAGVASDKPKVEDRSRFTVGSSRLASPHSINIPGNLSPLTGATLLLDNAKKAYDNYIGQNPFRANDSANMKIAAEISAIQLKPTLTTTDEQKRQALEKLLTNPHPEAKAVRVFIVEKLGNDLKVLPQANKPFFNSLPQRPQPPRRPLVVPEKPVSNVDDVQPQEARVISVEAPSSSKPSGWLRLTQSTLSVTQAFRVEGAHVDAFRSPAMQNDIVVLPTTRARADNQDHVEFKPRDLSEFGVAARGNISGSIPSCVATYTPGTGIGESSGTTSYGIKPGTSFHSEESSALLAFLVKKAFDAHFTNPETKDKKLVITVLQDMGTVKQQDFIDKVKNEAQSRINAGTLLNKENVEVKKTGESELISLDLKTRANVAKK